MKLTDLKVTKPDDPFNLFWRVTEEIMDNLSQPLLLPTAALNVHNDIEDVEWASKGTTVTVKSPTNVSTMIFPEDLSHEKGAIPDDEG